MIQLSLQWPHKVEHKTQNEMGKKRSSATREVRESAETVTNDALSLSPLLSLRSLLLHVYNYLVILKQFVQLCFNDVYNFTI